MKKLPLLVYLTMAIMVIALTGQLHNPIISLAEEIKAKPKIETQPKSVKLQKTTKPAVKKQVKKKASRDSKKKLDNGNAYSDAEIKQLLERTPNGSYLLPHYKAVGKACRRWNVNPALLVGMFQMECNLGRLAKNNNYGNIRRNSENYEPSGTPPVGYTSRDFAKFRTPADGINAYCWLLHSRYLTKGYKTVPKIVNRYAPKKDNNNTEAYIKVVNGVIKTAAKD